jgi:two-component system cell cycle sensor histidine kinase/response regulator CckA
MADFEARQETSTARLHQLAFATLCDDPCLLLDARGLIVDCNAAAEHALGAARTELLNTTWTNCSGFVSIAAAATAPTEFELAIDTGPAAAEHSRASIRALHDGQRLAGYRVRLRHKSAADPARELTRYRALLRTLTRHVWVGTADGQMAALLGLDDGNRAPPLSLEQSLAVLHPDDRPAVLRAVGEALGTGRSFGVEARAVEPDGRMRHLALRAIAMHDDQGATIEWIGATLDVTAEREAAAQLTEAERRLRLALATAHLGVWEWDLQTGRVLWSPECYSTFGMDSFAGTVAAYQAMLHPEDCARELPIIQRCIAEGTDYRGEVRVRHDNGKTLWIANLARVVHDEAGRAVRVIGTAQDVTERKLAEQALRTSEERLRIAIEAAGLIAWSFEPRSEQTSIIARTPDWADFVGDDAFAPIAAPTAVHADDRQRFVDALASTLRSDAPLDFEGRLVSGDGRARWTVSRGRCHTGASGERVLFAVTVDLSARRHAEDALRQSEESFARAIQVIPIAICVAHRDTAELIHANDPFLQMFGLERTNAIGRSTLELGIWSDPAKRAVLVAAAQASVRNVECTVSRGPDQTLHLLHSADVVHVDGQPCIMSLLLDITDLRRADEMVRQAQKMEAVGRLAGGVAHDFNNLLSVIGMSCFALSAELPPGTSLRAHVDVVHDALQRGAGLTRQLLALSRRQITKPVALDLNEHLRRLANLLRHMLGEDITLATALATEPATITIDPSQLEQVVLNIAVNARDAMPSGGRFTIRTSHLALGHDDPRAATQLPPGPYIELTMTDDGVGMTAEVRARVFEPFFSTKAAGRGTGLGLAVVHGIVQQAGGGITVESTRGEGTTVCVLLPAASAAPAPSPVAPPQLAAQRGTETLLVVEDQDDLRRMLRTVLRSQGYRVLEASNAAQALSHLDQGQRPDVLLTDVILPHVNGRELSEAVRNRQPGVRVIYMSGYPDDQLIQRGVLLGAGVYLQKPFTVAELSATLRRVLAERNHDQGA